MKIKVAWIGKTKEPAIEALTAEYLKRISRYAEVAGLALKDEDALLSLASGARQQKLNKSATSLFSSIREANSFRPKSWPSFWSANN
jgi:23S rRNA pseudoU1915 N3-methylase RlmH